MPRKPEEGRNPNGLGSLRTRPDGLLEMRVSLGKDASGRYIRRSVYAPTEREVIRKAKALERAFAEGKLADPSRVTVAEYVSEWLAHKAFEVEPRTIDNYQRDARRYLLAHLEEERLRKLTISKVKRLQRTLAEKHGPYSANRAKNLLSNILNDAIEEGLLAVNPAERVKNLKHEKKQIEIWTADEIERVMEVARPTRWHALLFLALATGMRHGELTGLCWNKVSFYPDSQLGPDEDHGEIRVDLAVTTLGNKRELGTPKTPYSIRSIGFSRETRDVLLAHREALQVERQEGELVFPTRNGTIISDTNTSASLDRLIWNANPRYAAWIAERKRELQQAGLGRRAAFAQASKEFEKKPELRAELQDVKRITFHDLRHTFASMMIAAGVDPVRLSKVLGHSDPGFTMRTYAHFFERQRRPPMPSLSQLTGKAVWGKNWGSSPEVAEIQEERDAA